MFPSVLKRFRRHLLAVAAGCDVCCILQCASDGRVRSPICCPDKGTIVNALVAQVWDFLPTVKQFAIRSCLCCVTSSCCCVGRGHTHTPKAALRPGTAAAVKRSARLDCVAVSPLGSVVMPGSASFNPPKTARTHAPEWLPQCSRFHRVQVVGPRRNRTISTKSLSMFCYQIFSTH